ncbi:MAG: isoaspartyl peptidase/L-asparaginase [Brevundimonas sp.]|uniref:isoaspartyl peptidase/L-asparaginase family protein n=1 Tax=Brevundimonas sp. TaxID=1871086 RepID=UPI002718C83F|nr:isoaspartyl peptidase/L-asparaginase [Brevundimonas sp.]MDO9589064.1 isoaspartyl peptidase/L-asparaginase [Brevundimonas sp.]MDP3655429.1 isoaspartyl peptidase/L-asparaginase [Brevundimonas sp.]MDZ4108727.1 isoaspartyl peptidase/L-asparaginase [Brevundimonas sp.]
MFVSRLIPAALSLALLAAPAAAQETPRWSFAIHGGAGVIERDSLTPEQDAAYRAALHRALEAGSAVLAAGGSSLDAVQAAVELMEDDPLFNAGRGAVFTAAGRNELDAAVMDGSDLTAGAVAGLTTTRHPIAAARAVMERSPHVMLIGDGADTFAASVGLEQVDPAWFFTERRWRGLETALRAQNLPIPRRPAGAPGPMAENTLPAPPLNERKFGTVGAVALDSEGRLAAGTSTGGMTAKRWGRVGDVPVLGAGTYASNADGCAVSATGSGEYFIRATVARDICASMGRTYAEYDRSASERSAFDAQCATAPERGEICLHNTFAPGYGAASQEIEQVGTLGGEGGVIVMNREGRPAFAMNTSGMYRGAVSSREQAGVAIYGDEDLRP